MSIQENFTKNAIRMTLALLALAAAGTVGLQGCTPTSEPGVTPVSPASPQSPQNNFTKALNAEARQHIAPFLN